MEGIFEFSEEVIRRTNAPQALSELELQVELSALHGSPTVPASQMKYQVSGDSFTGTINVVPIPTGNVNGLISVHLNCLIDGERKFHRDYASIHYSGMEFRFHYWPAH